MYFVRHFAIGFCLLLGLLLFVALCNYMVAATRSALQVSAAAQIGGNALRSSACYENGIPHPGVQPIATLAELIQCNLSSDVVHLDFRGGYNGNPIGNDDLRIVESFPNLLHLDLADTAVRDDGLRHIAQLGKLRILDLRNTAITDDGLLLLGHLKELKVLHLDGTQVQGWGVDYLKSVIPKMDAGPKFDSGKRELIDSVEMILRDHTSLNGNNAVPCPVDVD